jgi:hypothetical protein
MPRKLPYPLWQNAYLAAMLERDSAKMKAKIDDAEDGIHRRMVNSKAEPEERQAVLDALNALSFLRRCSQPCGLHASKFKVRMDHAS